MNDRELIDNIRKFWLLQLIVDCGNFKEAASRAKVTQSALSQTVSQLESLTGRVLLKRDRGHVEATEHCRELLMRVQPVLSAVAQVTKKDADPPAIEWMSLGAYESFASDYVPELITRLQLKCPGIRLTLRVARSGALATLVRKGDLCMAIIRELDEMGRLDVIPITTDRLGFWAASAHPAVEQGWASLPEHEIGTLSPDSDGHPRYQKHLLDAASLKRHPMFVSDSFDSLRAATQKGALVAILPESLATAIGPSLVEIRPLEPNPKLGVHKICLISKQGCDPRENEFLAAELRDVISERSRGACAAAACDTANDKNTDKDL